MRQNARIVPIAATACDIDHFPKSYGCLMQCKCNSSVVVPYTSILTEFGIPSSHSTKKGLSCAATLWGKWSRFWSLLVESKSYYHSRSRTCVSGGWRMISMTHGPIKLLLWLEIVSSPSLHCLPITTFFVDVFVTPFYSAPTTIKTCVSRLLISNYYVLITSKVRC